MNNLVFLSARNLGDAVFHAAFLRTLVEAGFARRYLVWTFPAAAFLFEDMHEVQIVTSSFPMGATLRGFMPGGLMGALRSIRRIRRWRPTVTLELVSDFRERLLCRWLGAPRNITPEWPESHGFRRHARIPRPRDSAMAVPEAAKNVYAAYDHLLCALIGHSSPLFLGIPARFSAAESHSIAIHPFASATFKLWPPRHWQELIVKLAAGAPDSTFVLFGAPCDRAELELLARNVADSRCEIVVGSLPAFRDRLARTCLLIGLDSFSAHLAHSLGVPSVILFGANDPALFAPPSATTVYRRSECAFQPCGGKPRCVGTSFEYACMKSIDSDAVRDASSALIRLSSSSSIAS